MIFRCFIKIENQNRIAINANGRQQTMAECFSKAFNIQCQFKNKSNKIQTESFNLNANARKIPFTPACASFSRLLSFACRSLSLSSLRPAPRSFSRFVACFLFLPSSILLSLLPSSTQYKEAHQCALNILGLVAIKEKALEIVKRSIFYSISS